MVSYQVVENVSRVLIEGDMTIYTASEIKTPLWEAVQAAPVVEVDLSQVAELDSAGLQLLVLIKKHLPDGSKVTFVNHSQVVIDVIELMQLAAYFNDPLVLSGRSTLN
ncbi:STAS domain-containing protein [Saccharospirillum mangrovi]|uniref:STAS domain-containing protein n=1 Tax=Saccharospirillum mangrovi TaxID=2161747 RepID=UPI000D37988E|nr:STAS domain-containing protein [Saccharospirillum mangrovi]